MSEGAVVEGEWVHPFIAISEPGYPYGIFEPRYNIIVLRLPADEIEELAEPLEVCILGLIVHELTHWAEFANMEYLEWWASNYNDDEVHIMEKLADEVECIAKE